MKTSTHRLIQIQNVADGAFAKACAARRAALVAAEHGMRGAALLFSREVTRAHGVYLAAAGRIARTR